MFSSPLGVPIHPRGFFGAHGELRPAGNHEPEVTATFADHIAGKRNPGVDIGTGRCGDTLYAMGGGTITTAGLIGFPVPNAITIRIRVGDYEPAVTHMASIAVNPRTKAKWKVGDVVNRGEAIGALGSTGASACHCHMGMKQLIAGAWVEIDGWPLLDQNQETTDMLKGTAPERIINRQTRVLGNNTRFRPSPGTADPPLAEYAAGTLFFPDYRVQGGLALGTRSWLGGWSTTPKGVEFGYLSEATVAPLLPIEQAGHTDQELVDAEAAGREAGIRAAASAAAAAK